MRRGKVREFIRVDNSLSRGCGGSCWRLCFCFFRPATLLSWYPRRTRILSRRRPRRTFSRRCPLTRAHPLVARGGALPRGNEVMMILNPFSNAVTDDISEMLKVCVLPTPPCTRAERGVRATHLHTHPHPTPAQPYHSRRNQPAPPQCCGFADPFLPRRVWRRTRENKKRLCSQSSSSLHSSSAL